MATRPIKITAGNTTTQELTLDYPNREAFSGDAVLWIKQTSDVGSIEEIKEKTGCMNVWTTRPQGSNNWRGIIKSGVPQNYEYEYYIKWKKGNQTYTHDPKITINPARKNPLPVLVAGVVAAIAGVVIFQMFLRKKK